MNKELIELNEDERDCLQELMNIAYGSAAAAISEILDAFATLNIPDIKIITLGELKDYLKDDMDSDSAYIVSNQLINGKFSGETLFLIDIDSAKHLAREFDIDEEDIDDDELFDVVLEITNILSSSMIGRLAEELEAEVSFSPPIVQKINSMDEFKDKYSQKYSQVMSISTELLFEKQKIKGKVLFIKNGESAKWIKKELNKILDEF